MNHVDALYLIDQEHLNIERGGPRLVQRPSAVEHPREPSGVTAEHRHDGHGALALVERRVGEPFRLGGEQDLFDTHRCPLGPPSVLRPWADRACKCLLRRQGT
eukprot:6191698-Pleurochrysis_carterae.AAC.3